MINLHQLHGLLGYAIVLFTLDLEAPQVWVPAHEHELDDRKSVSVGRNLGNERKIGGNIFGRQGPQVPTFQPYRTAAISEYARYRPQKRGFSRAVWADQTDKLTPVGVQTHAI